MCSVFMAVGACYMIDSILVSAMFVTGEIHTKETKQHGSRIEMNNTRI